MATENKTSEYDAEQNMAIAILNALNNANQPDGGNSANTSGDTAALIEMLQGNAPQGMDFSAFQPLMAAMGDTSFTRENAIADSKGFINQIFRDYEKSSLPSIYKNARATGIYNDTSTQLLANDAYSSAVAKGQAQLVSNITQYAGARQDQLAPVLALLNAQTSNANTVTNAGVQNNGLIANAMQSGINQQNVDGSAPKAPNTDIKDAAAIAGTAYNVYKDWNSRNTGTTGADPSVSAGRGAALNSDPYADNIDDELYYN